MIELSNFPKLECPFVRKVYPININDWKKHGRKLQLRKPEVYLVTPEINPEYKWIFDDPKTFAIEKLDGTNIKLQTEKGRLVSLYNRKNPIDPLQVSKGKLFIIEGVFRSIQKGYVEQEGEQAGELIGPSLQGNPYRLNNHLWYPFEKAIKHLRYKSFHDHDRTFDNWSLWFKDWLFSRFSTKRGDKDILAEGVIFYNLERRDQKKKWRAKLRRDMFDWYYSDKVKIIK